MTAFTLVDLGSSLKPFILQFGGESGMGPVFLMVGMMVILYFFMIRPQQSRQKKERLFRDQLKKDDKVLTIGGLYGRIVSMDDESITLEVDRETRMRFERAAIKSYVPQKQNLPAKNKDDNKNRSKGKNKPEEVAVEEITENRDN